MATLNIKLHPNQLKVFQDQHPIVVLDCGRRWGKTWMASWKLLIAALNTPEGVFWIVSPKYSQTKIMWRMIKRFIRENKLKEQGIVIDIKEGELYITFFNYATIWAKTGDDEGSLRGEGLDGLIIDEASRVKQAVWEEALEPALMDKRGWVVLISTPFGKNWFYKMYLRGSIQNDEVVSYKFPSEDNPFLDKKWLEKKKRTTPEMIWRQEYLAEFLDSGGMVFRGLDKVLTSRPEEPIPGEFYLIGVDLGRHEDFTIIKVGKLSENREVYRERFNQSDWDYIKERIRSVYNKYNKGCIIMDSTGYGDPIYEDLSKEGLNINGINMNVSTKPMLIENLQLMIENQRISLINDSNLTLEFGAYTYTILPSGNVRYEAASGFHDDEIVSTALMAIGMQGGGTQAIGVVEPPDEEKYGEKVADYDDLPEIIEWDELEEYEKTKFGR